MAKGERNGLWKGANASYAAKHIWMTTNFGRPQKCDSCGTTEKRMYHWANVSGTYTRQRDDWLRLCVPCHKSNDIKVLGGKIKAKPLKVQPSKLCAECTVEFFKNPRLSQKQWETRERCGRACAAIQSGRTLRGTKQSNETKALKSAKLKERWLKPEWRESRTTAMIGNQYAKKMNTA